MKEEFLLAIENCGLSKKEAKVYLVVLEMGPSIASTIARRTSLNRTSIYEILASLTKKGIVIETQKDETKYFSVISPEVLNTQMKERAKKLDDVLPSLLAIAGKWGNKPKIEYYDGAEGLKRVFEKVLEEGYKMNEPYLSFLGTNIEMDSLLFDYLSEEFGPKRLLCPTKTKVIASNKNSGKYTDFNLKTHESLLIDDELFDMGNEIVIYGGNKVAVLMYAKEEQSGLIIESKTLYSGLKSVFNLIWKAYKK